MFRHKKSPADIVSESLVEGKAEEARTRAAEAAQRVQEEKAAADEAREEDARIKGDLKKAYNAAAGLIEGLDYLKGLKGSRVSYQVQEKGDTLLIMTNIPDGQTNLEWGPTETAYLRAEVTPKGDVTVLGGDTMYFYDYFGLGYAPQKLVEARRHGTEKALSCIAKKAAVTGLVP